MSAFDCFSDRTVKAVYQGDVRRGKLSVSAGATAEEAYAAIRSTVLSLFGHLESAPGDMQLMYTDDEGDLCTLTPVTIGDLALLAPEGVLRLTLKMSAGSIGAGMEGTSSAPSPMKDAAEPDAGVGHGSAHVPSQSESAGVDSDLSALRIRLQSFVEKIDPNRLVFMKSIIQGMEPTMLHNLIGFASAGKGACKGASKGAACADAARDVEGMGSLLAELHSMDPGALHALIMQVLDSSTGGGSGAGTENPTSCGPLPANPLEAMFGTFLGGKGTSPDGLGFGGAQAQQNPLASLIKGALSGKGFGKGAPDTPPADTQASSHSPAPQGQNGLADLLGAVFAGKGAGKGGCPQAGSPPNPLEAVLGALAGRSCGGSAMGAAAVPAEPPAASPAAEQEPQAVGGARTAFEESVDDLIGMGLVSDRQMARELLTQHGDISAVVAVLME